MDAKLPMSLRDHLIAGCGWLKVYFDDQKDYPYGEVAVDVLHPDHVYADPDATSIDTARYIIQATPTPLWMIRRQWEKGKYVKADDSISLDKGENSQDVTVSADTTHETEGKGSLQDVKHKRAWLIECWLRDDTVVYEEEQDDEGNTTKNERPKYPNGRRLVVAGDVWLNEGDDQNPYEDGKFPFVMIPNYEQTGEFWPKGDVEYLIETNNDINKIVSRLNDWIRNSCHTYLVLDKEANVDEDTLDALEGAIITKDKAGQVAVNMPPGMPPAIFEWLKTCKSDLEIFTGIREVLQGREPAAGQSGIAFERLQEFAMSRIRKKGRNIDSAVKHLGELFFSRIRQYYTEPRQIRITGDFPINQPVYDQMTGQPQVDPMTGQPKTETVGYRPYQFMEFSNQQLMRPLPQQEGTEPQFEPIDLDIVIETGTSAAATRAVEQEQALDLLKVGVIDEEECARRYGIKNYKEIEARILQKQMLRAQMQAQMIPQGGV
jgi:hypothetical protein